MVPNTPRTLREILPFVITQIVDALASGNMDRRYYFAPITATTAHPPPLSSSFSE